MTLTTRSMGWLNQNRMRAYPLVRDEWRAIRPDCSGMDAILLDALVLDPDAGGSEDLTLEHAEIRDLGSTIGLKYGKTPFTVCLTGGTTSGEGSFSCIRGFVRGGGLGGASVSLVFSSHAYLLETIGTGSWNFGCRVLASRLIRLSGGIGVEGLHTSGSSGVEGHAEERDVSGDVVLEDGYRTSPIISEGRVFVRVGRRYGLDPCSYDFGDAGNRDCRNPLFFFCGQNAVNSGNIILRGGPGISVTQGRTYEVNDPKSKAYGKRVPCIEIVAGSELVDICTPSAMSDTEDLS